MSDRSLNKFAWLEALRGADLTHAEYRVAVNLSTYARADLTNAWPGIEALAGAAHANEKTVKRALAVLITKGWVLRTRPATGRRPAVYSLTFPRRGSHAPTKTETRRGSDIPTIGNEWGSEAPTIDIPADGIAGVSVPSSGGQRSGIAGVPVGPDQWMINGEINENPCRDDSEDEPHVDVEPSAPTPSDAGLFDLADPEPIDAELVDELTRSPVPAPTPKPPKSETPEQRVTATAYERVGKAFNFIAVRAIAKWAIHDRGEDPAVVEAALVGVHELGRPIMKQTVGQWLDGILSPEGTRPGGISKQDAKVNRYLDTGRQLKEGFTASGVAREERAPITAPSEQMLALPSSPAVDPARDPLAWIDGDLPGGFGPGERDRAAELLEEGTDYHRVRWAILHARNARPTRGLRRRTPVDGTTTTTAERALK